MIEFLINKLEQLKNKITPKIIKIVNNFEDFTENEKYISVLKNIFLTIEHLKTKEKYNYKFNPYHTNTFHLELRDITINKLISKFLNEYFYLNHTFDNIDQFNSKTKELILELNKRINIDLFKENFY